MREKQVILPILITIFSIISSGCITSSDDSSPPNPDEIIQEYIDYLLVANYSNAIGMLINTQNEGVDEIIPNGNLTKLLTQTYSQRLEYYLFSFEIDLNSTDYEDSHGNWVYEYNISYEVKYDSLRYTIVPVIILKKENVGGILWEDEEQINSRLFLFPKFVSDGYLSLNISCDVDEIHTESPSLNVSYILRNEMDFPLLLPGEDIYSHLLKNTNGTQFIIPPVPIVGDRDVPPRTLLKAREEITFIWNIATFNWHYPEWRNHSNPEIQLKIYYHSFDFDEPGNYTYQAIFYSHSQPQGYSIIDTRSNIIEIEIK